MNLIENKKVYFNYEILDKFDAGMELFGGEVKSIRGKHGSLDGSYISIRGNEAFLIGSFIPPYQPNNKSEGYDPYRDRRLLLTKEEINELVGKDSVKGLTVVPLAMYNGKRHIKLSFGLAKSKREFDKREVIKKRETEREMDREMKKVH